jgi:inhibitor of cysteine peptidase
MGGRLRHALLLILMGLVCVWGCSRPSGPPESIYGEAQVDSVEMSIVDGFPARAMVVIRGDLKDDCTRIESIRQELVGSEFVVTVAVERPVDRSCVQKEALFTMTVPLGVEDLPAGLYVVTVNGVSTSFDWRGTEGLTIR